MRSVVWLLPLVLGACGAEDIVVFSEAEREELRFFVGISDPVDDPSNRYSDDPAAAHLGQFLFFDPRLSGSGDFSCASCHQPEHGFADPVVLSETVGTTQRHTQSLLNVAYQDFFYWDGRKDSLWSQALSPIENTDEMAGSRLAVAHLVVSDSLLAEAYVSVFGALPDLSDTERFPEVGAPGDPAWEAMSSDDQALIDALFANVGKAIAAYEQLLVHNNAPFDRFVDALLAEEEDAHSILSTEAQLGLKDFIGDAKCDLCHFGPNFSNRDFHNLGLPLPAWDSPFDGGRFDGIPKLLNDDFNTTGVYSDDSVWGEEKIGNLVISAEQLGQFKTPTLRNLLSTPPYMHAGHFETLEQVFNHYAVLDSEVELGHREEILLPLEGGEPRRSAMVAFLESLEGEALDADLLQAPTSPLLTE